MEIFSGIQDGISLGSPIAMNVRNEDARPRAYTEMREKYRPSHADFTYDAKYGRRMAEGGGRASARESIGRVAAGAIAGKALSTAGIRVMAWIQRIEDIEMDPTFSDFSVEDIEATPVRCPQPEIAEKMIERIKQIRSKGDSVGGVIAARIDQLPVGLGEPIFDRLEADLAKAMLSIPATKGFEFGSGFAGTRLRGSVHNDLFERRADSIRTRTNFSGGIQGGISNGEPILFRVAFKPTATILKEQETVDVEGNPATLMGRGRHDACVLPRAVPIVEAMAQLVLMDHWMRHQALTRSFPFSKTDRMR